ncbi:protein OSCP1 isoform X1 [Dendroctonus ponderosae]|uniref:Protein OSCP1 n=2 Tax=Dendroctonus ponderosae TaxID=77166 RepID=A0AAR5QB89_DENPD|nr:protein OSCP1 isoform X1 [Dendroctonus ponderosae]KAH1016408.1 hypothetical protein HUJ04_007631 [Dendroctonus ponderosae]
MSLYSTPFVVLNLGSEMIFVVARRLQAQNISEERAVLVLEDLIAGLTSNRLIKELMRPQTIYSQEAVREIIENIANNSSSMKLDAISMNKLWDLITMVFKWQLAMSSAAIETSQRHLAELEMYVASEGTQLQLHRVQNIMENFNKILNPQEKVELHKDLVNWCQNFHVRVSLLLRMGLQDNDGQFIVNNLDPVAEKLLENIGSNIYEATENGRILENRENDKKASLALENVNELNCFVDEMLGERKLSSSSTDGSSTLLRLSSLTETKLNNNGDDRFDNIDVNVGDSEQLQHLMTDLSVRDDLEQNSFKDDLLSMIEGGQSDIV